MLQILNLPTNVDILYTPGNFPQDAVGKCVEGFGTWVCTCKMSRAYT